MCLRSCKTIAGAARRAHSARRTLSYARRRGRHRPRWPRSARVSASQKGRALQVCCCCCCLVVPSSRAKLHRRDGRSRHGQSASTCAQTGAHHVAARFERRGGAARGAHRTAGHPSRRHHLLVQPHEQDTAHGLRSRAAGDRLIARLGGTRWARSTELCCCALVTGANPDRMRLRMRCAAARGSAGRGSRTRRAGRSFATPSAHPAGG